MKIKGITLIEKGSLLASISVEVSPGVTVNEFKIQKDRQGEIFVAPPVIHWVENRQHYYQSAITLSESLRLLVEQKVIEYYVALKEREV